jgi:6-phosphofructokinase 1
MKDDFGHVRLGGAAPVVAHMIGDNLGYKYHWAVADYLQRAARHLASKTDVDQAYALGKVRASATSNTKHPTSNIKHSIVLR